MGALLLAAAAFALFVAFQYLIWREGALMDLKIRVLYWDAARQSDEGERVYRERIALGDRVHAERQRLSDEVYRRQGQLLEAGVGPDGWPEYPAEEDLPQYPQEQDMPPYPTIGHPHLDALPPHWVMLAQVWRRPSSYLPKEMQ